MVTVPGISHNWVFAQVKSSAWSFTEWCRSSLLPTCDISILGALQSSASSQWWGKGERTTHGRLSEQGLAVMPHSCSQPRMVLSCGHASLTVPLKQEIWLCAHVKQKQVGEELLLCLPVSNTEMFARDRDVTAICKQMHTVRFRPNAFQSFKGEWLPGLSLTTSMWSQYSSGSGRALEGKDILCATPSESLA